MNAAFALSPTTTRTRNPFLCLAHSDMCLLCFSFYQTKEEQLAYYLEYLPHVLLLVCYIPNIDKLWGSSREPHIKRDLLVSTHCLVERRQDGQQKKKGLYRPCLMSLQGHRQFTKKRKVSRQGIHQYLRASATTRYELMI